MRYIWIGLAICGVLLAQTKSTSLTKSTRKTTYAARSASGARPALAKAAPAPKPDLMAPSTLNAKAPAVFRTRFMTTKGPVVIEVTRAWAPLGADRFYNLVRAGFFTDLYFFRVVPGFMAQFGMSSRPEVIAKWKPETINDEPVIKSNTRGMVTFAKTGQPNSRSVQFFINFGDNSRLDAMGFAPFGRVVEGMENVDKLYSGYGEQSNNQGAITEQGKAFFEANFPLLDKIVTASVVPAAAPVGRSGAPGRSGARPATARPVIKK